MVTGLIGIPPANGVLPQCPMHTRACISLKQQLLERDAHRRAMLDGSSTSLIVGAASPVSKASEQVSCGDGAVQQAQQDSGAIVVSALQTDTVPGEGDGGRQKHQYEQVCHSTPQVPAQTIELPGIIASTVTTRSSNSLRCMCNPCQRACWQCVCATACTRRCLARAGPALCIVTQADCNHDYMMYDQILPAFLTVCITIRSCLSIAIMAPGCHLVTRSDSRI